MSRPQPPTGDTLQPEIASLLRMAGLGLPKTEAEVVAAEKWLAENPVRLPASLLDPLRPKAQMSCWLIESSNMWLSQCNGKWRWGIAHQAIRFCRRADAEAVIAVMTAQGHGLQFTGLALQVTEHLFMEPEPVRHVEEEDGA